MTYSFGGYKFEGNLNKSIEEEFEEVKDDIGEVIYASKKVYQHNEEGLSFKYQYAIRVIDLMEMIGENEGEFAIEINLVIAKESLSEKVIKNMLDIFGWEEDEKHLIEISDIMNDGEANVRMASEVVHESEVDEKVLSAFSTVQAIDSLRGFHLDKAWNQIGTTGWDIVKYATGKRDNLFEF